MVVTFQLGKATIDRNYIETIRVSFKRHDIIKIKVLKTQSRDKCEIKQMAESLTKQLEDEKHRFSFKIIGFTIILIKRKKHGKNII